MGNRGIIHDDHKQLTHTFKNKAWITCLLEFKGRKRGVMTPGRWTELFFLDEATSFAAGHRPCFECRRDDAKRFKSYWIQGNPSYHFTMNTSIKKIDEVLHRERIDQEKKKITWQCLALEIAEGTFILFDTEPYVLTKNGLRQWTPFGYEKVIDLRRDSKVTVLTPKSIVNAFRAGYIPRILETS